MIPTEVTVEAAIYVDDSEAAEALDRDVLGPEVIGREASRHAFLRVGDGVLLAFPEARLKGDLLPPHGARGPGHLSLGVRGESLVEGKRRLGAHGILIEKEVGWPSGGRALYIRDPAVNSVELVTPGLWGLPSGQ